MYIGVGKDRDPTGFVFGLIDDGRIYDLALTAEEIAALAQGGILEINKPSNIVKGLVA